MAETAKPLPQLIDSPSRLHGPLDYYPWRVPELRKVAAVWHGDGVGKMPREAVEATLRGALKSHEAARRILKKLSPAERVVVAAYRRYGGEVDGEIIRLDLKARGTLEVVERRHSNYTDRQWKRNFVRELADRWILLTRSGAPQYLSWHCDGPDRPFSRYGLQATLAALVEPAGPPPWSVMPAEGVPEATVRRSAAEVAMDLSRLFAFVVARGAVKTRMTGTLSVPALRALEKAVPVGDRTDIPVPDPHTLYFELLVQGGAVRIEGNSGTADPAAGRMFAGSDPQQAHAWARAWLRTRNWIDGLGASESGGARDETPDVPTARQVVAWALGCLARAGDHWYDLGVFLTELHALQGDVRLHLPHGELAWDPPLAARVDGPNAPRYPWSGPFRHEGHFYANILMGTLVELGLVERGRMGPGAEAPHAFRLTEVGRAVFGAPEVPTVAAEAAERRFLVVQPNFDVLAYVDEADACSAGLLGRIAEADTSGTGPVRTFRLTRESVYRAEEGGLGHDQIVGFLERHARGTLPANLLRSLSDWTGKRESLVLRTGVNVIGFPSEAARDDYLKRHAGTACGARFVLAPDLRGEWPELSDALVSGFLGLSRRTLKLDEHGTLSTDQPLDIVQRARLGRLASPAGAGWRITGDSIARATASGLKPPRVHQWLSGHLLEPMPPLIAHAIDAWMGKAPALELGDVLLLHIPEGELARVVAASPRLRPFLVGRPGRGWLMVRHDARKALTETLEELGFTVGRQLNWAGIVDGED